MSTRRNKRRRIRYRPGNRRILRCAYIALGCVAAAALLLSARVLLRSARTATLNRRLVTLHTVDGQAAMVQVAAPPVGAGRVGTVVESASDALTLSTMGMPDGSPIVETAQPAGNTVFHKSSGDIQPDMRKLIKTERHSKQARDKRAKGGKEATQLKAPRRWNLPGQGQER